MHTLIYALPKHFMRCAAWAAAILLCLLAAVISTGCANSYNYCSLDTQAYGKPYNVAQPEELPQYNLTSQMLTQDEPLPDFINVQDNVIYISADELTNFVVDSITGYCLCFTTNAVLTVTESLRNYAGSCVISTAPNLTLILQGNIYSGNQPQQYLDGGEQKEFLGAVLAGSINLFGTSNAIHSSSGACVQAQTINFNGGKLIANSDATAIIAEDINMYGQSLNIIAQDAIEASNLNIFGGFLTVTAQKCAINCIFLRIFNGDIEISSKQTAINCKTVQKSGGFVRLYGSTGINAATIQISSGLLYANCNNACIKATNSIIITGGTNLLKSKSEKAASVEAENIPFEATGGLTVQCSSFVTKPTGGKYYGFKLTGGQTLYLQYSNSCLSYVSPIDGTLCISGNITPTNYTFSGRIKNFKACYYGLLLSVNANLFSLVNIDGSKSQDFGANWCNLGNINEAEGQLF